MPFEEEYTPGVARNYFQNANEAVSGLKYRLDGRDVIKDVCDKLRGGFTTDNQTGERKYNESFRLMNEIGISRAEFFLTTGVNKITHLTKYKNEDRIMLQMKALAKAWIVELAANMKNWAPESEWVEVEMDVPRPDGQLVRMKRPVLWSPPGCKVRNKTLVVRLIENALFTSMQRGDAGFEALNTTQSMQVSENIIRDERRKPGKGFFNTLLGRGEGQ